MKTTRTMRWAASAVGAALFLTPLALAGSASAAPMPAPSSITAHTTIKNAGDSGNQGNVWAKVGLPNGFSRDLTLKLVSHPSAAVWNWAGSVSDHGTGVTVQGAVQPNGTPSTATELHSVPLNFFGSEQYTFSTNANVTSAANHGVPFSITRNGTYYSASPISGGVSSLSTDDATTSAWYALAFPGGTTFTPNTNPAFSYTYKTGCGETWVDANAGAGGNITGKTCSPPHVHPTPPHGHPVTHYFVQASGHVQSEQSNKYLAVVDGRVVQENLNSSNRFAMMLNTSTHTTGLAVLNSHGSVTGWVSIPDSGQATVSHSFTVTDKRGSYYSSADGTDLNNARYSHASGNHQIGWPAVRSLNEQYTSPGQG